MTPAPLIARAGCAAIRALVGLHPADFRSSFGATVIDEPLITRMVVGQGAMVLAAGLAFGIAGAVGLGRVLRAQLFGVQPADPLVIAGMTTAFALCGLLAIAWPARAAATLDPATGLKE